MAFDATSFLRIHDKGHISDGSGSAKYQYAYTSADSQATIETSGYFNSLASVLTTGDSIGVTGGIGGTGYCHNYFVTSNGTTTVTLT